VRDSAAGEYDGGSLAATDTELYGAWLNISQIGGSHVAFWRAPVVDTTTNTVLPEGAFQLIPDPFPGLANNVQNHPVVRAGRVGANVDGSGKPLIYVMAVGKNHELRLSAWNPNVGGYKYQDVVVATGVQFDLQIDFAPVLTKPTKVRTARQFSFDVTTVFGSDAIAAAFTQLVGTCDDDGSVCTGTTTCSKPCTSRNHVAVTSVGNANHNPVVGSPVSVVGATFNSDHGEQYNPEVAVAVGPDGAFHARVAYKDTTIGVIYACTGGGVAGGFQPCAYDSATSRYQCPTVGEECFPKNGTSVGTVVVPVPVSKLSGTSVPGSIQSVCSRLDGYWGDYDGLTGITPMAASSSGAPEWFAAFTEDTLPVTPEVIGMLASPPAVNGCMDRTTADGYIVHVSETIFK
jgi:hypothetical protein